MEMQTGRPVSSEHSPLTLGMLFAVWGWCTDGKRYPGSEPGNLQTPWSSGQAAPSWFTGRLGSKPVPDVISSLRPILCSHVSNEPLFPSEPPYTGTTAACQACSVFPNTQQSLPLAKTLSNLLKPALAKPQVTSAAPWHSGQEEQHGAVILTGITQFTGTSGTKQWEPHCGSLPSPKVMFPAKGGAWCWN